MSVNNAKSKRQLSIYGYGWCVGKITLDYIGRHSCTGAILDEEDFEIEEGTEKVSHQFLSFSNSLKMNLTNLDNSEEDQFEFKNLKKLGLIKENLNPEDLKLTNSFEKIPRFCINHWQCEDEEYYLEFQDIWKGLYGKFTFEIGEVFDLNKLEINIEKLDTNYDFYEWVCKIKYKGKIREDQNIIKSKRIKILRVCKPEFRND